MGCVLIATLTPVTGAAAAGQLATAKANLIAHGKHLLNQAVLCGDCHSPHTARGEMIPRRYLRAAKLESGLAHPVPGFAPSI